MTSREARNLLSGIQPVPGSIVRLLSTPRTFRIFSFTLALLSILIRSFPEKFIRAKMQRPKLAHAISQRTRREKASSRSPSRETAQTERITTSAIIKREIFHHERHETLTRLICYPAMRYDRLLTNPIASLRVHATPGRQKNPKQTHFCNAPKAPFARTHLRTYARTHVRAHPHTWPKGCNAQEGKRSYLGLRARDALTFADACRSAVYYLQRVVARRAICNGCFMPH